MTRTLLFTDRGRGPVCAGVVLGNLEGAPLEYARGFFWTRGTKRQRAIMDGSACWWLVECENANDGRYLIEWYAQPAERRDERDKIVPGRVLAQGGAA